MSGLAWPGRHRPPRRRVHDVDDAPAALVLAPGVSVAGDPCLVRLYPMAKGRTRGNAALAVELDVRLDHSAWHTWLEQYWGAHLATLAGQWTPSTHAARTQVPSDPGLVWFESKPSPDFYRQAVAGEVTLDAVPDATWSAGGLGIIGATAAVAWPLDVSTWEGIAWRQAPRPTAPVGRGGHGAPRSRPTFGGVPGPKKGTQSAGTTWHVAGLVWPKRHRSKRR